MDIIKETLRWCNEERAARGIGAPLAELPKGIQGNICECPVARALGGAEVGGSGAWFEDGDEHIDLPDAVDHFVTGFDAGHFPELVAA